MCFPKHANDGALPVKRGARSRTTLDAPMRCPACVAAVTCRLALLGTILAIGCATPPPPATHERCARARLARQWQDARPERFIGCYVDDAGAFAGTLILTHVEDEAAWDDEPRIFRLYVREAMLASVDDADDGARWALMQSGLIRLSFPAPPGPPQQRAFEAVEACLATAGDDAAVSGLVGEVAAVMTRAPFLGPPSPVRLRRIPCVR